MSAGGSLPGWAVGMSIFGTYLSSNTFLGNPGKSYAGNYNAYVFTLSLPVAAWIATKYFVPFYRQSGEISAYHHLEERFGLWARTYAMACYVLSQIARMGTIMFGVALGLNALTGWDIASIIVVTGMLVTLYTLLGGIEAVIWTDVVQSIVLMGGAILIFAMLLFSMPDGPSQAFSIAGQQDKISLGSWRLDFTSSTIWVVFLFGLFINLTNFGIDQSFVQRYHTAKTERDAQRSIWIGVVFYVPISLLFFAIGSALFSYYQVQPDLRTEVMQQVAAEQLGLPINAPEVTAKVASMTPADYGDKVLPHFIANKLPVGLAGLLIAAIFAAAMSSIDTSLNSSATVFLKDIYGRYIDRDVSERHAMLVLRSATVVIGIIGTGIAVVLIGQKSILDAWWQLQGIFAGGMLGLFLLGMVARTANGGIALISVIIGVLTIGWMTFYPVIEGQPRWLRNPLHTNMTIVIGTLAIFLVGLLLSQFVRSPPNDTEST
ncbi:Sodium/glucose cotransporter [Planctomycetes bacterium K23_9]|uniref:Sodium/glucose cotransporter n=2 Tax=Stieleria marina TaxID=1930275 RepID=A0A517NQK9_9BACT|nr:Sodium/glucose cotransporter [Planctomycetes bacterium K23_9]